MRRCFVSFRIPTRQLVPAGLLAVLVAAGCASSGGGSESPRGDREVLTFEELQEYEGRDLLVAIESLRPRWLRLRPMRTFSGEAQLWVIVDGVRRGGPGVLRSIRVAQVEEARYLSGTEATTRMGTDMAGGAILVTLRTHEAPPDAPA
jgi:hypothetical protein